jgi:hypothetical protein
MLYFQYIAFLVFMSILLVVGLVMGYILPETVTGSKNMFLPQFVPRNKLELVTTVHGVTLYLLCFLVVVRWMWNQDRTVKADVEEEPYLRNYALVAEGFPKSARSPHEVKAFFESILGFELEGVSIAYDHCEEVDFVSDRVARAVEKADTHLGVYPSELSGGDSHAGDSQDGYNLDCLMCSGYAFVVFSREEDREFCMRLFAKIDKQVREGKGNQRSVEEDTDTDNEEAALLKTGVGRGSRPNNGGGGPSAAVLFRGKFPIHVGTAPEPCGIQWQNFTVRRSARVVRMVVTLLTALLLVVVLGATMFAPAVLFEMSFIDIRRPSRDQVRIAFLEGFVVVVSAALSNRLLVAALRRAARLSGFMQKANEDALFVLCAYCSMCLNTVAPLAIAYVVARTESATVPRPLIVEWLFASLCACMLSTELCGLMAPAWSFWSNYFWIRQSTYLSVREAGPSLTTAEFPLATRYADLLHVETIVCAMIACDSSSLYTISAQCLMLLYCVFVYFTDKYTFLRIHRHTYYTSPRLDGTVHYLFVFPLSILSIVPVVRTLEYAPVRVFGSTLWVYALAFFGQALVILLFARICQKCNEPRRELSDIPYVEVASLVPYNYFNTNPVHVLRTLHFPSIVVPPIYPFMSGKEYLQGGQFADYDDSVRLRETLMQLAKNPLKGLDDVGNPGNF